MSKRHSNKDDSIMDQSMEAESSPPQNKLNKHSSRRFLRNTLSRIRGIPRQSNLSATTTNNDGFYEYNNQSYEDALKRFNSKKQRMQESPEEGDIIKCANACIILKEENFKVIPLSDINQQAWLGTRNKERMMSAKICDNGCNRIKETVVEQTNFSPDGLIVTNIHTFKKCNTDQAKSKEMHRESQDHSFDERNFQRPNRGSLENRENDQGRHLHSKRSNHRSSSDSSDTSEASLHNLSAPRRYLAFSQSQICCQVMPGPCNSNNCCVAPQICSNVCQNFMKKPNTSQRDDRENNNTRKGTDRHERINVFVLGRDVSELIDITPPEGFTNRSLMSNSGLHRRPSPGNRAFLSSTKYDNENNNEEIDNISIQLYSSSTSMRAHSRARSHYDPKCRRECEEKCCRSPTKFRSIEVQTKDSKVLSEIEYDSLNEEQYKSIATSTRKERSSKKQLNSLEDKENFRRNMGSQRIASLESSRDIDLDERAQNIDAKSKSIATSTRTDRSSRNRIVEENIQNISEPSAIGYSKIESRSNGFRLDDETPPTEMERIEYSTISRKGSKLQRFDDEQSRSARHEYIDEISQPDFDDESKLDNETPPFGMEFRSASSRIKEDDRRKTRRPILSSTKYDHENLDEEIDSISIELYNSSTSMRSYSRSGQQQCDAKCRRECKEKCSTSGSKFQNSEAQKKAPQLLAEIFIPTEYNRGIRTSEDNAYNTGNRRRYTNSEDLRQKAQNTEVEYKSIATSTRTARSPRKRINTSQENIQDISEPSAMDLSRTEHRSTDFRLDDETPPTDMERSGYNTSRRKASRLQRLQSRSVRDEYVDDISQRDFDDESKLDDETPPFGMDRSANSRTTTEDSIRQQHTGTMRRVMVPLAYIDPTDGCPRSCRCKENQPNLVPFSLRYRTLSDDDEDDADQRDALKRKLQNERSNR